MTSFNHLHVHSSFSFGDSLATVDQLFKSAKELGMSSIALTEHGSLASLWDGRKAAIKYGIKYIPGCEFYFVNSLEDTKEKRKHIVLLAKNKEGYKNLLKLNYKSFQQNKYVPVLNKIFPQITWADLENCCENMICLTACSSGIISRELFAFDENGNRLNEIGQQNAEIAIKRLKNIFKDNLYLEIQPHTLVVNTRERKTGEFKLDSSGNKITTVDQSALNEYIINAGAKFDIPIVATCDVHYILKEDATIHDMLMAINDKSPLSSTTRHRYEIDEFYFKTGKEVFDHVSVHNGADVAARVCKTTLDVADRCDDSSYIDVKETRFPKFEITLEKDYAEFSTWRARQKDATDVRDDDAYLRFQCIKGFNKKFAHLKKEERQKYIERIKKEINVLEFHKFSSYMLIVSDFIRKAKEHNIRVGPGRGSAGGSLVAHLIDIHEVDPLQYDLLFERFHNKEKTSFPDIDTDFSPDGRDWVEQYITERYGKDKVAHVSNLSKMTPKVVIKDIARSLELGGDKGHAFQIANKITDAIPDTAKGFDDALSQSEEFRKFCIQYPRLETYGRKLAGLEKTYATHAAGVVIGDIDLSTYIPLRIDKEGVVSVQYEKNRCESAGLIKMDLLGLEHLRIIDRAIKNAQALGLNPKQPEELSAFDDEAVWDDISKGHTMCVFQMGSPHMRALCKRMKPKSIEDLALINALGRPSAAQSRDIYVSRRDGSEPVTYKHKCLEPALKDTLGICVFEEQLARLANVVAGWDLNKADNLRKLTKLKEKGAEFAAKWREEFVEDAIRHSKIKKEDAEDIWDTIIDPFSKYGFNKAHGIFYSINGYHSAYYKHYYPAPFMAAVLESEVEKASSPVRDSNIRDYKKETKRLGIEIKVPDINKSGHSFTIVDNKTMITGLSAIKGVGKKAVDHIIEVRDQHKFLSFADFLYRTSSSLVRKNIIQPLAQAGCYDSIGISRKCAFDNYALVREKVNKHAKKVDKEGREPWEVAMDLKIDISNEEWLKKEILLAEQETMGEFISGTPYDLYEGFFTGKGVTSLGKIKSLANGFSIRTEAVILDVKQSKLKKGKNAGRIFARCTLQDMGGISAQMTVWPEQWLKHKDSLKAGSPVRAICKINSYKEMNTLVLERIEQVD